MITQFVSGTIEVDSFLQPLHHYWIVCFVKKTFFCLKTLKIRVVHYFFPKLVLFVLILGILCTNKIFCIFLSIMIVEYYRYHNLKIYRPWIAVSLQGGTHQKCPLTPPVIEFSYPLKTMEDGWAILWTDWNKTCTPLITGSIQDLRF